MKAVEHPPECPWHRDWHGCNCGLFDTIRWIEPGPNDEPIHRYCSGEEAVKRMFDLAANCDFEYGSIKEAIDDFVSLNWAWIEK